VGKSQNHLFGLPPHDLAHILSNAATDLEDLRGQRMFITGGTGFFGKWLVGGLCHANVELGLNLRLTVLSRNPAIFLQRHPEAAQVAGLGFVRGDVSNFAPNDIRCDYVVHGAADTIAGATESEERTRILSIVEGTRHVLAFVETSGVRRMLNISSGAVYGDRAGQLSGAREDDYGGAQAATAYGASKREAEELCAQAGVDFVTARAFAFLGPHLPLENHFAAGNFLRDAVRGDPITVRGDGTATRSYLYPADLVVWLLRILSKGRSARAYNVGSDEAVTTAQLARMIASAVQPTPEVVIQSIQPQGPQNIYLPLIARARTELHLNVAIPLHEAIARTLAFLQSHPD
jgi:nucleoside-diphosphate-sugar epimerase